jgi:galactokinase
MGEHTDYNAGLVLPFALSQATTAVATARDDDLLVVRSAEFPGESRLSLGSLEPRGVSGWAAYPAGVAWALRAAGYQVRGAEISYDSDVPGGAGLSSSAAIEAATALALCDLSGIEVDRAELTTICQRAENEFVGAPTGIMDQSASLRCKAGHALLLDCRTLEVAQVPFDPAAGDAAALLVDTRADHHHAGGGYGDRRAECEEAARQLGVPFLGYITDPAASNELADPVLRKRARHVIADDARVRLMVESLRAADPSAPRVIPDDVPASAPRYVVDKSDIYRDIGALLTEAHISLRDDFEISWPEADATVEAVLAAGGLGARMVGGGFGGSVLTLIPSSRLTLVRETIRDMFARNAWAEPRFFDAIPSDGASRVS